MKLIWWALGLFVGTILYGALSCWLLFTTLWDITSALLLFVLSAAAFLLAIIGYRNFRSIFGKIGGWLLGTGSFLLAGFFLLFLLLKPIALTLGGVKHITASESPDGYYTVNFIYFDAGATGTFGIRGELDGPLWFTKRVYYEQRVTEVDVIWKNDNTIVINGHSMNLQKGEVFGTAQENE